MKITKKQLRRIIREEILIETCGTVAPAIQVIEPDEGRVMGHGGSAKMAKGSLFNISKAVQSLHDRLNDEDELPEWVQSKIAAMLDDAHEIEDHLGYKIHQSELAEDVRKRGDEWCAYVDDKLTKAEKENNPKKYKGKKVGSVQKTKSGKPRMKARACYRSKKKANNAMAAAMMG